MGLGAEATLAVAVAAAAAALLPPRSAAPAAPAAAPPAAAAAALASAAAEGFLDPLVLVPERDLPLELTDLRGFPRLSEDEAGGGGGAAAAPAAARAAATGAAAGADSTLRVLLAASALLFPPTPPPPPPPKICMAAAEKGEEQSRACWWFRFGFFWDKGEKERGGQPSVAVPFSPGPLSSFSSRRGPPPPLEFSAPSALFPPVEARPPPWNSVPIVSSSRSLIFPPTMLEVPKYDLEIPFEGSGGAIVQRGTGDEKKRESNESRSNSTVVAFVVAAAKAQR